MSDAEQDGWLYHTDPSVTAKLCFNSHSPEKGFQLAKDSVAAGKHSSICFGDALTHPGYKDVPASWFFCEDDVCVSVEVQQVSRVRKQELRGVC